MISFLQMMTAPNPDCPQVSANPSAAMCADTPTLLVGEVPQDQIDRAERIAYHAECRDAAREQFTHSRLSHDNCEAEYHQAQIDRLIQEQQ